KLKEIARAGGKGPAVNAGPGEGALVVADSSQAAAGMARRDDEATGHMGDLQVIGSDAALEVAGHHRVVCTGVGGGAKQLHIVAEAAAEHLPARSIEID